MLSVLVNCLQNKFDSANSERSTDIDVIAVLAEYTKLTGAGRTRLVPVSCAEQLIKCVQAHGAQIVEPLEGIPIQVCDIKGRTAAGELLVADVRSIGAEFSPACRLGAQLALADDARTPGYIVVCMQKCCISSIVDVVTALAVDTDNISITTRGVKEQERMRASRHLASDSAQVIAAYLTCHPNVDAVCYPGLKSDISFMRATAQLVGGFGPIVDYMRKDLPGKWLRYVAKDEDVKCQIINLDESVNGTKTMSEPCYNLKYRS